jgi:hypothetical protein
MSSEGMSTIRFSFATACRFLFLFYGPSRWTEDVSNASGFRVERGMFLGVCFLLMLGKWFPMPPEGICVSRFVL